MTSLRIAATAVVLILCAAPAFGGSVTYDFIEGPSAPNPGTVGAILEFAAPPASATTGWTTTSLSDILNLQITDSHISPVGSYTPLDVSGWSVVSNGPTLDGGFIDASMGDSSVTLDFAPGGGGVIDNTFGQPTFGIWEIPLPPTPTPEPSSLVLVGNAVLVALGLRARRRAIARRAAA